MANDSSRVGIWQPLSNTVVISANTTTGNTSVAIPVLGISGYFNLYNDSANVIVANFSGGNTVTVIRPNTTVSSDSIVVPPGNDVGFVPVYPFNPYIVGEDITSISGQNYYNPTNIYVAVATISGTGNLYIQNGGYQ